MIENKHSIKVGTQHHDASMTACIFYKCIHYTFIRPANSIQHIQHLKYSEFCITSRLEIHFKYSAFSITSRLQITLLTYLLLLKIILLNIQSTFNNFTTYMYICTIFKTAL